jgi:hypothetical protein
VQSQYITSIFPFHPDSNQSFQTCYFFQLFYLAQLQHWQRLFAPGVPMETMRYLSPGTIAGLQLALYLENLEVNLFRSASSNITGSDVAAGISNMTFSAIKEATLV